jgi:hypothetical protein
LVLDWNVIATGLFAPAAVLVVKTILDFSLAHYFVKWFYWAPVRSIFRDLPLDLSGKWEQIWEPGGSLNFPNPTDRHSYTEIKQFGRYVYAEFDSQKHTYCLFGRVRGSYIVGEWFDKSNKHAYFGAFQLRIVGGRTLEGLYVGHSSKTGAVGQDAWIWNKC